MADILPFIFTLTPGDDVVPAGMPVDTLVVAPGTLTAGDDINLTLGARTMQFTAGGTYDLTVPQHFSGVQTIQGSTGNDALAVTQERLAGITQIDLGGGMNVVQMKLPGKLDLSAIEIHNATIRGTALTDDITGTRGDDFIVTAGGLSDIVDGGAGRDTVFADAVFAQLHEVRPGPADLVIEGSRTFEINGANLFSRHIERIELRDGVVVLDQGANGAEAYRLAHAAFGTRPLEVTILSTRALLDAGVSSTDVARAMMNSLEFERAYGTNQSDAQFVDSLYRVVLNRAADDGGRAVQIDALAHGVSRASLLAAFADSAEHVNVVGGAATNDLLFVGEVGIA